MWKEVGIFIFIHITTHYFEVSRTRQKYRKSYCTTPGNGLGIAAEAVSGLTNILKFYVKVLMDLVFIWYNSRCWSKILLSHMHTLLKITDLEILC